MAIDKNLFLHDLAIVAIMKNEAPYIKEWLDYHISAGVDHFYIYDNESPDNMKEILQPYIDAGTVTYKFYPGKQMQQAAYNEALQQYKFFCRYMAFVDGDEFIFPQENKSIVEITDEILKDKPQAGGLVVNWMKYGSNNLETADYSKGVLERFTRRAEKITNIMKTIANPRKVDYLFTPHYMVYFDGIIQIDENTLSLFKETNYKIADKIIMNHYYCKSREEYALKNPRGDVAYGTSTLYPMDKFNHTEDNDVFDDSILKYRDARRGEEVRKIDYQKLYTALLQNLSPTFSKNPPIEIFNGKVETFLTCRKLAEHLREKVLDEDAGKFFESAALNAIYKTFFTNLTLVDIKLILSELPNILKLDYPAVKNIRDALLKLLPQIKDSIRSSISTPKKMFMWKEFTEYDYFIRMLQTFDNYEHKN